MPDEKREPGRDGVTGLLTHSRFIRARHASAPTAADLDAARDAVSGLLARAHGQRGRR